MQRIVILEENQNYIILGPRQAGKSTLIKAKIRPKDLYINLLPNAEFSKYSKEPSRFHAEILQHYYFK
ncbi:MAG: AAA family ATPase [Bdellovibrionota bacterium]